MIARLLAVLAALTLVTGMPADIGHEETPEDMNVPECVKADYLLVTQEDGQWFQCSYLPDPRSYGWKQVDPEMPKTAFTPPPPFLAYPPPVPASDL